MQSTPRQARRYVRWLGWSLLLALLVWVAVDVFVPRRHSIRQFDPAEVARLETAMWRSYYDKKPVLLFWQLAGGLRQQFHAPFWRSFGLAFQATRAAFTFKQGQSRADYKRAIPPLTDYYQSIQDLTVERFDVPKVAALELEWWIVHRERERYSYQDLADALVQTSAALYRQPAPAFRTYAQLRANAMRLCDEARPIQAEPELAGRRDATEANWQQIEQELAQAWGNLHRVVQTPSQLGFVPVK